MSNELTDAIVEMREDDALAIVQRMLDGGTPAAEVLEHARQAMVVLGERFENEAAFIPELIMGGEIMRRISEELKPLLAEQQGAQGHAGTIVLGTVQGDIHDIGKDVVVLMLQVNGYNVVDLGVDVAPQAFIDAINEHQPQIVGLSGLLTLAFDSMKKTVAAIDEAGLRSKVKIMIGGAPVDEVACEYAAADGWGRDAGAAMSMAAQWTGAAAKAG